jgi:hypothetical protein
MWLPRMLSVAVFVAALIGALYYTARDNEIQGAVVVLLGILYFVALPHLVREESPQRGKAPRITE